MNVLGRIFLNSGKDRRKDVKTLIHKDVKTERRKEGKMERRKDRVFFVKCRRTYLIIIHQFNSKIIYFKLRFYKVNLCDTC